MSILFLALLLQSQAFDHIYILYTNDIEGALSPSTAWWMNPYFPPPMGNASAAATLIKEKRAEAENLGYGFLLCDAGDMFVGSPLGEFSEGMAVAEYFNYCGYDVMAPGNHDYDQGVEVFRRFTEQVEATFLGSNIVYEATGEVVEYLEPYTIVERLGSRIGIFSLLTEYMSGMTTPERFAGHKVLPEIETAARYVDSLRSKDVDLIFAITGIGLRHDKRVAEAVPGIDVILGSHSASALEEPYEDPLNHTIICQAYGHLSSIGFLDLWIDKQTNRIAGYRGELVDLLSEEIDDDTTMLRIVRQWEEVTQKEFDEVIGYSRDELMRAGFEETAIGNLITDAMREFMNVDIAIHNSGGIRANLPKGEITYRHCYNIDALSNTAVTMEMTGRQIIEALEVGVNGHHAIFQVSGLKFVYDSRKSIGERVQQVVMEDGSPMDPQGRYTLVTNSFLAAGGGEYVIFKSGENITDSFHYLRNIIAEYVKKHSPIVGRVEGRIIDVARR
ncbi:5'-nucleotidase C-terminal domain-containing protein [candidate division WOR-3 bacterium]|nr:5'-nucleotidase C-terminal domain-containing protein [candidate division WOR-3 bacterium]